MNLRKSLAFLLLVSFAFSALAAEQRISISVTPDGVADITHAVQPRGDTNVSLALFDSTSQPDILVDGQPAQLDVNENALFFAATDSVREIRVHYKSTALTSKSGISWSVQLAGMSPAPKIVVVRLPPQAEVTQLEPWGSIRLTRDGLVAQWKEPALVGGTARVQYSPVIADANETVPSFSQAEDMLSYAWIGVAIVVILALAWFGRNVFTKK